MSASLVVLAVVVLGAAGCGGSGGSNNNTGGSSSGGESGESKEPIHVAMPADLTGSDAGLGEPWVQAAKAAVKYTNDTGGLDGHEVILDVKDTQSDPNRVTQVTSEMLSTGNYQILLIGGVGTADTPAYLETAKRYPEVIVLGSGNDPALGDGTKNPMAFSTNTPGPVSGEAAACLVKTRNLDKVGMLSLNEEYYTENEDRMKEKLEGWGIEVVGSEPVTLEDSNVTAQLQALQGDGAETLYVDAFGTPLAATLSGLKALNWHPRVVGSLPSTTTPLESFVEPSEFPKAMEGVGFEAAVKRPGGLTENQKTAIKYIGEETGGKFPSALTLYAFSWDAMMLARWAGNEAETTNGKEIAEKLNGLSKESNVNTGALIAENPRFTSTIHYPRPTFYALDQLAPMKEGVQPSEGAALPPECK